MKNTATSMKIRELLFGDLNVMGMWLGQVYSKNYGRHAKLD
ncbi:hypothetical protein [Winogradskyella sp. SM1960]|nr:hypothetical protein [Winogradskyella sp. SM1960]